MLKHYIQHENIKVESKVTIVMIMMIIIIKTVMIIIIMWMRRGQKRWMLKMLQHSGKEYGVQMSSLSRMENGLTKQKRRCHLKNRIQWKSRRIKDDVKIKLKSLPDWKGAGPDKIQDFW